VGERMSETIGHWNYSGQPSVDRFNTVVDQRDELLAALKDARQIIRDNYRDERLAEGYWPSLKPKIDALDAAITKAEGR
jgi:hypothetical protein